MDSAFANGICFGLGHSIQRWDYRRLELKELPDTAESQEFLCTPHGVFRPEFFIGFIRVVHFQIGLWRSEKSRLLQASQIFVDLLHCKEPPDFRHECRQLAGKLGVLFRCLNEVEEFLSNQIAQCVL